MVNSFADMQFPLERTISYINFQRTVVIVVASSENLKKEKMFKDSTGGQ